MHKLHKFVTCALLHQYLQKHSRAMEAALSAHTAATIDIKNELQALDTQSFQHEKHLKLNKYKRQQLTLYFNTAYRRFFDDLLAVLPTALVSSFFLSRTAPKDACTASERAGAVFTTLPPEPRRASWPRARGAGSA